MNETKWTPGSIDEASSDCRRGVDRGGARPRAAIRLAPLALAGLALALTLAGCDRGPEPPPIDVPPAPDPFPPSTHRGIDGDYTLTGGRWTVDMTAYSHRYHRAWDRLSVLVWDAPVRADAVRITQPTGYGAPLQAFAHVLAAVEIEIYDRPANDVVTYVRDTSRNLASRADLRAESEHPTHTLDALTDGIITAELEGPLYMSEPTERDHWIEARFDEPTAFNQIVIYWPFHKQQGPWHRDVGVVDGLRAQELVVQVREGDLWRTLPAVELRPGSLHDGAFIESWLGMPFRPASRLDHMLELESWWGEIPRGAAGPAATTDDEVVLSSRASITVLEGSPELTTIAAQELARAIAVQTGGPMPPITTGAPSDAAPGGAPGGAPVVTLGLLDDAPETFHDAWRAAGGGDLDGTLSRPGAYAVLVTESRIYALGRDARGSRYAACRLEERMETAAAPRLARGAEMRRPAYAPRAAAAFSIGEGGPNGLGVSDAYLSLMAHYYLDGLYLFQAAPYLDVTSVVGGALDPALTPDEGKLGQLRGLIARAKRQGIGVYWCVAIPGILPPEVVTRHPEIRTDHPDPYVVCLSTRAGRAHVEDTAERVARALPDLEGIVVLRTELTYGCGGRALCDRCRRETTPETDPAQALFRWVETAVHRADPDMAVIAFDWRGGGVPAVDVDALPSGVGYWLRPDRIVSGTLENDLRDVAPHAALGEALASIGTRHLYIEEQLSHPFPFHTCPEVPVADLYVERWTRRTAATAPLRAGEGAPRVGLVGGNGGGFYPTPTQDLILRELAWEPRDDRETMLRRVATRWFGPSAADDVRAAWRQMSQAVREHAVFQKYLTRLSRMRAPGFESGELTEEMAASTALLAREVEEATARLQAAVANAPPGHRRRATRALALAGGFATSVASLDHAARWGARYGATGPDDLSRIPAPERARAAALLREDIENTHRTIALFGQHAVFRAHPYYRNWFGLPVIASKVQTLDGMIRALEGTPAAPSRD